MSTGFDDRLVNAILGTEYQKVVTSHGRASLEYIELYSINDRHLLPAAESVKFNSS